MLQTPTTLRNSFILLQVKKLKKLITVSLILLVHTNTALTRIPKHDYLRTLESDLT